MHTERKHLDVLDGVRGLMALWVLLYHTLSASIGKGTPWGHGSMAVEVFMILSGFLMAYHWGKQDAVDAPFLHRIEDFYIRRFFRIAPLYYVVLIGAFMFHDFFLLSREYVKEVLYSNDNIVMVSSGGSPDIGNIMMHLSFLFGLHPAYAHNLILPDWSIGLEMQFYFVFPFIMFLIPRIGILSVGIISVLIPWFTFKFVGVGTEPNNITGWLFPQPSLLLFKTNLFFCGISMALLYLNKSGGKVWIYFLMMGISLFGTPPQVFFCVFLMTYLLIVDDGPELLRRLLGGRLAKFLGDTSYAVYLVHMMVLYPVMYYLFHSTWFLALSVPARGGVALFCTIVPTYFLSYGAYRMIEVPGIALGRAVVSHIQKSRR